jgi:hypothetical protein
VKAMGEAIKELVEDWNKEINGLTLQEWANELYNAVKEKITKEKLTFKVVNPGTVMKLLFLWKYMRTPYLHIMASRRDEQRKQRRNAKLFYLDLYAGNGVVEVKIEDDSIRIPGSSVLALLAPILLHQERKQTPPYGYYWDLIVLNDIDDSYRKLLRERYQYILKQTSLMPIYRIYHALPSKVKDKWVAITEYNCEKDETWNFFKQYFLQTVKGPNGWIHGLIFLDPPSPSAMPFRFLKELLTVPSDIIALLHTGIFVKHVYEQKYTVDTLANILDCDKSKAESLLQKTHSYEELEKEYVNKFRNLLQGVRMQGISKGSPYRDFVKEIRLYTGKGHYHLVVATRTTGGQEYEEWHNWFAKSAEKVEELSKYDQLDHAVIDILTGRQATL